MQWEKPKKTSIGAPQEIGELHGLAVLIGELEVGDRARRLGEQGPLRGRRRRRSGGAYQQSK